jgi:hypothetical protein
MEASTCALRLRGFLTMVRVDVQVHEHAWKSPQEGMIALPFYGN